ECRHERTRHAERLEARLLEADGLRLAIPDDLLCLDAPYRRLIGLFLTRLAGGVDAAGEGRDVAFAAIRVLRGEIGVVGCLHAQGVDEAVPEVVGDVDLLRVDLGAVRGGDLDSAAGNQ